MNRQKAYLVAATLLGVAGLGYGAYAQTGTAGAVPPRLIPFQGYLEDANGPVNGSQSVTFFITNSAMVDYTASCSNATCMWAETQSAVQFSNGYFSTALGSVTPFSSGAANLFTPGSAEARFVRVRIGTTTLAGAQRLLSSAFAITAETAANFTVTGVLAAGSVSTGTVNASGNVTVSGSADVRTGGGISVGSTATDPATGTLVATADVMAGDGMRVGNHPTANPTGGDIVVAGDVDVDGNLDVAGSIINGIHLTSEQSITQSDEGTASVAILGPGQYNAFQRSMCFLTRVLVDNDESNSSDDPTGCRVYLGGITWYLEASVGPDASTGTSDWDASCSARCLYW